MEPPNPVVPRAGILAWFANPLVGLIGTLASIIGVMLAMFFYYSGQRKRDLAFYVHPVKTTVVKGGQSSALRVLHNNVEITSDVTAVQFAFWNQGSESIRPENVLHEIAVSTKPPVPILEAKVLKSSRSVAGISIDASRADRGLLVFSWKILEHNDGGIIQLIHAGPPDTALAVAGIIEGQSTIAAIAPKLSAASPRSDESESLALAVTLGLVSLGTLAFLPGRYAFAKAVESLMPQFLRPSQRLSREFMGKVIKVETICLSIALAGGAIYFLVHWLTRLNPPFTF